MFKPIEGTFVIGLGHKARHGKDTAAKWIIQNYGAEKLAFSDALYDVARVVYDMKEKDGPLLQLLGTEIYRRKNPDIWVNTIYWKLMDRKPKIVVIPDVRFPNEADFVRSMGGVLIKVNRLNEDGSVYVTTDRDPNHPSETSLDGFSQWNFVIYSKDVSGIHTQTDEIMRELESLNVIDRKVA